MAENYSVLVSHINFQVLPMSQQISVSNMDIMNVRAGMGEDRRFLRRSLLCQGSERHS